jgi:hypothetical protein
MMNDQRPINSPSHVDLGELARGLRRAAVRDDTDSVHGSLCRLRNALVDHLHAEEAAFGRLPVASAAIVLAGQRRLLDLLDELLLEAVDDEVMCGCLVAAAEVDAALQRQARLEEALLRHHPSLDAR